MASCVALHNFCEISGDEYHNDSRDPSTPPDGASYPYSPTRNDGTTICNAIMEHLNNNCFSSNIYYISFMYTFIITIISLRKLFIGVMEGRGKGRIGLLVWGWCLLSWCVLSWCPLNCIKSNRWWTSCLLDFNLSVLLQLMLVLLSLLLQLCLVMSSPLLQLCLQPHSLASYSAINGPAYSSCP